jgi:hypothetical protein
MREVGNLGLADKAGDACCIWQAKLARHASGHVAQLVLNSGGANGGIP